MTPATSFEAAPPDIVPELAIEREVARSAHATVFYARRGDTAVALKRARQSSEDPLAAQRLAREAAALARVAHPCVLPLLDAGLAADGSPYVVTPWVIGQLLEDRLRTAMAWPQLVAVLAAVARGLAALHAIGVVHRDLKPTNLILPASGDPAAIILDLGHARLLGDPRITQSGAAVGSLAYMAPEQLEGGEVDGRCDLYALGVILYRALTGALPGRDVVRPRRAAPEIPQEAEDLCLWLLARKPADRLPSATVLAATLAAIAKQDLR